MFPGAISSSRAQKIDSTPKPSVQPLARRGASQPMWTTQRFNRGWMGGAWLSRCKPGVTDALLSAIYRRGVWKGTNASRTKIRFFFGVRNWMCGVRACENMQKRVSHGETVRVGSSGTNRIRPNSPIKNSLPLCLCLGSLLAHAPRFMDVFFMFISFSVILLKN